MGKFSPPRAAVALLLLLFLSAEPAAGRSSGLAGVRGYDSIVSFGDSFADTGNNPVVFSWYSVFDGAERPPYGSTFFGHPTGRCSDGRLIIDFIAARLGLPLVPPFLAHNGSFRGGANFAVAGATALDAGFFHELDHGASPFPLNTSLAVQLQWFESLKPSICATIQDCKEYFGRSLFFVGGFGFNDYTFALLAGMSVQQTRSSLVPDVVRTISMAIERLIKHGAMSLVVPGIPPVGCAPQTLALFGGGADPADYDPRTGCLREINEVAVHHNSLLQEVLHGLRAKHPETNIVFADFFSPVMEIVESPAKFGFEGDILTACCGGPGGIGCGHPVATSCRDPSARLFWDDVHLTEAAYRYIAGAWLSSMNLQAASASSS